MFEVEGFLDACVRARRTEPEPRRAIRELAAKAMARSDQVADRLMADRAGITMLHHAPDITIINVVWAPRMKIFAHDHRMWAAIGVYAGREDNQFLRRDS